jgi:hypothetical protein
MIVMEAEDDRRTDLEMRELDEYRGLLFQDAAFQWLLASIKRECQLAPSTPDYMGEIRRDIVQNLPSSHRLSREHSAEMYTITLEVQWSPTDLLQKQGFETTQASVLETFLTLTGSSIDAQAITCIGYMEQTWPFSGAIIMGLITGAIAGEYGRKQTCEPSIVAKVPPCSLTLRLQAIFPTALK